jgi:hypothetical protein
MSVFESKKYDIGDTVENANSESHGFGISGFVTNKTTFNKSAPLKMESMSAGTFGGSYQTVPALVIDNLGSYDESDLAPKRVVLVEKEVWSEIKERNKQLNIFSGSTGSTYFTGTA